MEAAASEAEAIVLTLLLVRLSRWVVVLVEAKAPDQREAVDSEEVAWATSST